MTRYATSFVLGYHGCDRTVGEQALKGDLSLIHSEKDFDWLGPGIYFWEGNPVRAAEWAQSKVARGHYAEPFVIGAVIDLGNCLDLLAQENLEALKIAHQNLEEVNRTAGLPMPKNKDLRGREGDKTLRFLDCAVIKHLHTMIEEQVVEPGEVPEWEPFDTVRGFFVEGTEVYPGSGFYNLSHTQIAVRKESCVKGIFLPRPPVPI